MKSSSVFKKFYVLWVLLGAMVLGGLLYVIFGLILLSARPATPDTTGSTTPMVTIIPAPTLTQVVILPTQSQPTTTTTPNVKKGDIGLGVYVQISGTNGEGLRLRAAPGTASKMLFLGMDEEVFLVKDGPRDSDGFTWWFLQAPYDNNRSGWAAANYLKVINRTP